MAKPEYSKARILAIERMFQSGRPLNSRIIIEQLAREYDIQATRKTIYDDIAVLTMFLPIDTVQISGRIHYKIMDWEY